MGRKRQDNGLPSPPPKGWVACPFTVVVDSREQSPYTFANIRSDADQKRLPMRVEVVRAGLATGDYTLFGFADRITLERKSISDLYGSISRRANFEARLARMDEIGANGYAAVMVEAEFSQVRTNPPPFTKLLPKSVCRTILAWDQRFPAVHWWFMPGRDAAEAWTFRILERFWKDHRPRPG
jgi:DNA excision repair protein ERCC-4